MNNLYREAAENAVDLQSVYQKVQEVGLITMYTHSTEVAYNIRMLPGLAYLPPESVFLHFKYSNPNLRLK